jgi:hypothetical protein
MAMGNVRNFASGSFVGSIRRRAHLFPLFLPSLRDLNCAWVSSRNRRWSIAWLRNLHSYRQCNDASTF